MLSVKDPIRRFAAYTSVIGMAVLFMFFISCGRSNDKTNSNHCSTSSSNERIMGIDVSHHQENIDWDKFVKSHGDSIKFVYVKATEGATYVDPRYKKNIKEAKNAGLKVGAYHYFRTSSTADVQFENFKKNVKRGDLDLIPMVDVEECKSLSVEELKSELNKFIKKVEDEYDTPVMVCGTQRSYNSYCAPDFNNHPLMIGRYNPKEPQIKGGATYTIWQFSENGSFEGIPKSTDINLLNANNSMEDILIPDISKDH